MKVGLAQSNVDQGWNWLKEVSVPTSSKYGQHWSAKDIAEAFAPSNETVDAAKNWLTMAGISESRIKQSQGLNWLEFDATVDEAEELLKTKYHVYEHEATGQPHVACDEYSIPTHLREHIDLVYPTVHFDAKIKSRDDGLELEKRDGTFGHGRGPRGPGAYVPSDLDLFFANFSQRSIGERPIFDSIDGGVNQQTNMSFNFNGESDLDLEYSMTLVYPQPVTLYQVGDLVEGASFNNFLDAIDASYCSYDGGDDPTQDAKYPDPYGGYQGPENCGGFAATKVISTSYAYNEADLTPFYEQRQCYEYMKLGMMGVSVLYSSGDYGVAGNGGQCLTSPVGAVNATFNNGTSGRFNPSFPGTCPYITSVGATQVKNNTNIVTALATGTQPEEACETVIYSGGGFSNVFPLPEYQANAVHHWFADYPPPYGPDRFNNSQQTRGLPDMSANGANYVIAIDGNFSLVYGTSASSPTTGSILTLINQARLDRGKSSIGFINPVIYAHPEILNDITEGGNQGCGTPGFESAPGWDPVTGLGTPNYPKMLKLWVDELN
ncbi:hypothetical protein B0A54_17540 [Friedmanniomyces endolithicus]|uniref:Peptidase S53 domain-containing protein n=1 Tax=Friedmanniomyces endolithicus TaxID=329885 RepID=A0A4U0TR02_9PEZI|nr:hypothetical protein B0A54_17540 [Friedmanniomyces endolithicus]